MAGYVFPRRATSTATTVTVSSVGTPAWVTSLPLRKYATIPMTRTIAQATPGLASVALSINGSYSGLVWNEDYGTGGGALFTGGGHSTYDYPYSWVFDGSLPGWVALNVNPPAFTYATGSEFSTVQADMGGGSTSYGAHWFKRQGAEGSWGYPARDDLMNYGECATGVPGGFHAYNYQFAIPANTSGMGAKGGWGSVVRHSITTESGIGAPWGHKIDAQTGTWSRWPVRLPRQDGSDGTSAWSVGNYMASWTRACVEGGYAYTSWGGELGAKSVVKSSLTTGAHQVLVMLNAPRTTNNTVIIPGTTIMCSLALNNDGWDTGSWERIVVRALDVSAGGNSNVYCTMSPSNLLPLCRVGTEDVGSGQAALMWVPEVSKFAAFGTTRQDTEASYGSWPLSIFWITPPANVQTTYSSGTWTVEEETLSVVVGDTTASVQDNRGPYGKTYQCCFWSSKLRCFIHLPRPASGYCFYFRTEKVV